MYALGEIPEVEDVVGLGWRWQEICAHTTIYLDTERTGRRKKTRRR